MNKFPKLALSLLLLPFLHTAKAQPYPYTQKSPYEAAIDSAEYYAGRERFADAARCYRKALKANPGSPLNSKVFANLALCLTATEDYPGALEAFDVALVHETQSAAIRLGRARALILLNRLDEARKDVDTVLENDSINSEAHLLRGKICMTQGDWDKAIPHLTFILEHDPKHEEAMLLAGRCHAAIGNDAEAATFFRDAITLNQSAENYILLTETLLHLQETEQATEILREGIEKHPREGRLYLLRGMLHNQLYRREEAQTDKRTAVALGVDPQIADKAIPGTGKKGR